MRCPTDERHPPLAVVRRRAGRTAEWVVGQRRPGAATGHSCHGFLVEGLAALAASFAYLL